MWLEVSTLFQHKKHKFIKCYGYEAVKKCLDNPLQLLFKTKQPLV